MKILITGAAGMLGSDLREALESEHKLVLTDLNDKFRFLDITDIDQVMPFIATSKPDLVIHSAAFTYVDGCERDPEQAFRVNALGTRNIARACKEHDADLVYISTDFVFDGERDEPYTEDDATNPISQYGASKLAGENHVRELVSNHYVVRTAWLYGVHGKSFPRTMLGHAKSKKQLTVISDQVGSPTFTEDLAKSINGLINTHAYGTYHITNKGSCSWYEFAVKTLQFAGITDVEVKPIKSEEWPSPTKRPKYSVLRHSALEALGRDDLRAWDEALEDFISRLDV